MSAKPRIRANAETDDQNYSINFNAAPWFEQATPTALMDLIRCDYKDDDAVDRVALETNRPDLNNLFNYVKECNEAGGHSMGFTCTINPEDATTWIARNRPKILHHTLEQPLTRNTIVEAWGKNSNWDEETRLKHILGFLDYSRDHTPEALDAYLADASFEDYKDRARLILSEQGLALPETADEEEFLKRTWFTEISPTNLPDHIRQLATQETPEAAFIRETLEGLTKLFVRLPTNHEPIKNAFNAGRSVNDVIVELATTAAEQDGYVIPLPFNDLTDTPNSPLTETAEIEITKDTGIRISIPGLEHPDQVWPASLLIEHYRGHVLLQVDHRNAEDETCDETATTIILKGPQTTREYEQLWADFQNIPRANEARGMTITEDFFIWPAGTPAAEVIAWFKYASTTRIRPGERHPNIPG